MTTTYHPTREVTVKRSWTSRIALLTALENGSIILYDAENNPLNPLHLPVGTRLHISDPMTAREVTVAKNVTVRRGQWHVV